MLSFHKYPVFPTDCQIAKLKPLYKKISTTLPRNYWPISLLPLISKIINHLFNYLNDENKMMMKIRYFNDKNKILYRFQSEFRINFSTDLCLSYLYNKIATDFESGLYTDMILTDLQKKFDTINHEILKIKWNT